jgi:23S rRNA (cytosine1962-C5)-methyltransferase
VRARVFLKKDIRKELANGHSWIYANEIETQDQADDGELVDVFSHSNQFLGIGYINSSSLIRVRIISRLRHQIDETFFRSKIERAIRLRRRALPGRRSVRVVFGESDGLPGLIVDKFSDYLVVQISTLGMTMMKEQIIGALVKVLQPKGIYEKTDGSFLEKEGMEETHEWLFRSGPIIIPFEVHGLTFLADLKGQKTGFFLDQVENAQQVAVYFRDSAVLDVFGYTGNFSVHALAAGAKSCEVVDISERALGVARETMRINGFEGRVSFSNRNAFDYLREIEPGSFDAAVVDPPSLVKSRNTVENALRGYKELNLRAVRVLKNGGVLATSSCSQLISRDSWESTLSEAFEDNRTVGVQLLSSSQPPDHPAAVPVKESHYLKFKVFSVTPLTAF